MVTKKTHIIIQARTSSSRFPLKVIKKIGESSLIELQINRLKKSKNVDRIIVATSLDPSDDIIQLIVDKLNIDIYRGSLEDVLDRYYKTSTIYKSETIIRITGDCPLIDPKLIDEMLNKYINLDVDYYSNTLKPQYPDGQDVEIFSFKALEKAWKLSNLESEREHVTPFIYNNSNFNKGTMFSVMNHENHRGDFSKYRMTVDYNEDFEVIKQLINLGGENLEWENYIELIDKEKLMSINSMRKRNEGYEKSLKNDK